MLKRICDSLLLIGTLLYLGNPFKGYADWQIGPFNRVYEANPILTPCKDSLFYCPIQNKFVTWESDHVFNPGAIVREGKVYLIYRAEDNYGQGIGFHTSRLGLAESHDGIHFKRMESPILFPDNDAQQQAEFPGGCEDPRIVETEEGTYVMTYTQWNQHIALLAIATSSDLLHWEKRGYAFQEKMDKHWCKSGSIICRLEGDRLIATKIRGKYWMYWGEGEVNVAVSTDLIHWTPLRNINYELLSVLQPRPHKFDSALVESGPPAILTDKGIIFLYNGKNGSEHGDPTIPQGAYSAGQALFDLNDPTRLIARSESCFLTPENLHEREGQYQGGTVFIQGLVHFNDQWILYYGTADSAIGAAISQHP